MLKTIVIFCFLGFAFPLLSQESIDTTATPIKVKAKDESYMTKSPSSALWRSVIPGWGQYYNEDYWKAPILFGAAVGLGGLIYYFNSEFQDYSAQLDAATMAGSKIPIKSPDDLSDTFYPIKKRILSDLEIRQLKGNKEFNRDNRDKMALYLLGVYVISAVDAYVGAHLYDFNVDDELSYNMNVNKLGFPELAFSYSF